MKHIIWLLAMLLPILSGAQSPPIKPLNIGDTVPDVRFSNLYNYDLPSLSLSDFKGKLVILDFWATWCGSCIESFPKMEALQKKFPGQIKVIMVNDQAADKKMITSFFEKRKARTTLGMQLPSILTDTILKSLFPHKSIPHIIWIDTTGRFAAVTYPEDVSADAIAKMLNGINKLATTKNDELLFDVDYPLLTGHNGNDPAAFLYRSVITGSMNDLGAAGGKVIDSLHRITKLYEINYRLVDLFIMAYPKVFINGAIRTILEAPALNFQEKFCYEIITPPTGEKEIQKYMQNDLYRYFHAVARNEVRPVKCYDVIANSNIQKSFTRHKTASSKMDTTSPKKYMYNQSIDYFLKYFVGDGMGMPLFNETGIERNIDVDFPFDIYSFSKEQLRRFLFDKGFTLIETTRNLKVALVTSDILP